MLYIIIIKVCSEQKAPENVHYENFSYKMQWEPSIEYLVGGAGRFTALFLLRMRKCKFFPRDFWVAISYALWVYPLESGEGEREWATSFAWGGRWRVTVDGWRR